MEHALKFSTSDGHVIYATLNKSKTKAVNLMVFVHGLGRSQNDHIFYNAAKFFPSRGFDTLRFDFYSFEKDARKLKDVNMSMQISDVATVLKNVKKMGYEKIFLIGHSLGGPIILLSDTSSVDSIVLWDPSYEVAKLAQKFCFIDKKTKIPYAYRKGLQVVISKALFDEFLGFSDCGELIKRVHKPIKIISAQNGGLLEGGKKYAEHAYSPKDFVMIKNANHYFDEEGAEEKLFKETLIWLRRSVK